jgi:hypothetical protein
MATVWSVLILIGMALVVAHLTDAVGMLRKGESDLIERTYTTSVTKESDK